MKKAYTLVLVICSVLALSAWTGDTTTSYTASAKFAASSTTDNLVLPGNASTLVQVTEVWFSCTQTTAGVVNFKLTKRSTADSGGTSANVTAVPDDSLFAAAASVPKSYTGTGPTVGNAIGDVDNEQVHCLATSTASSNLPYIYRPVTPIKLHGAAEGLALNLGGAVTGGNVTVTLKWTEKSTN